MLIKLLPVQIDRYWDFLWEKMEDVIIRNYRMTDEDIPEVRVKLLEALLGGEVSFYLFENQNQLKGVLLIGIEKPILYPKAFLFVHMIRSVKLMDDEDWKQLLQDLAMLAGSLKCQATIGYSNIPRVCEMVEKFGHDAKTRILVVEAQNG